MSIQLVCKCGKRVQADEKFAGKTAPCPHCGGPITIPMPAVRDTPIAISTAESDIYGLATRLNSVDRCASQNSSLAVDASLAALSETIRVSRSKHRSRRDNRPFGYFVLNVLLLIGITVGATLWMSGFFSQSHNSRQQAAESAGQLASTDQSMDKKVEAENDSATARQLKDRSPDDTSVRSNSATAALQASQPSVDAKTPQDARCELQSRVDRYLGGQKDARGQKDASLFGPMVALGAVTEEWDNVEIERVVPSYDSDGNIERNAFKAYMRCEGATWTRKRVEKRVELKMTFSGDTWTLF